MFNIKFFKTVSLILVPTKFRLVDGPVPFAGRVEIRYAGIWGTINDRNFDFREGQVICRLLGYSGVASVIGNARYGQGSGPIWLSNVHCLGNETTFGQCPDPGFPKSRRFNSHLNDASLECLSDNTSVGKSTFWVDIWISTSFIYNITTFWPNCITQLIYPSFLFVEWLSRKLHSMYLP